jgi:hypothetical protein
MSVPVTPPVSPLAEVYAMLLRAARRAAEDAAEGDLADQADAPEIMPAIDANASALDPAEAPRAGAKGRLGYGNRLPSPS